MRMQLLIRSAMAVALAGSGVAAGADSGANADAGRDIAANCATCHGAEGRSRNAIPVIAGQDKTYLVQQLKDFRDGKRPSTIMQQLVKGYTDGQLEAAATYLSLQKPD
jgi:cytochrome c553